MAGNHRQEIVRGPAPDDVDDAVLRSVLQYWSELPRAGRNPPARSGLRPDAIPSLLPNLMLIETDDDGDLFYRLIGTAIVEKMGGDRTGKRMRDVYVGDDWNRVEQEYCFVLTSRQPSLFTNLVKAGDGLNYIYRRLLCPMTRAGGQVDVILGALTFEWVSMAELI